MRGLTLDTINEVVDRKVVWLFVFLVLLTILITVGIASSDIRVRMNQQGEGTVNPAKVSLGILYAFMSVLVFVSAMMSAASIPSMLGRGRCDFYLSKPISRSSLFLGKLFGMMVVYGVLLLASGALVSLVIALSLTGFGVGAFYIALYSLLELFVWLTIITWAGVFSGSTTVAIVTAFVVWILQTILGSREMIKALLNSSIMSTILDVAYWIVPKTTQLGRDGMALAVGDPVTNWWPLPATLGFGLLMLLASILIFRQKEL